MVMRNITKGEEYVVRHDLGEKEQEIMVTGGLLPWIKKKVVS